MTPIVSHAPVSREDPFRQVLTLKASVPLPIHLPVRATRGGRPRMTLPRVAASWTDAADRQMHRMAFSFQRVRVCLFSLVLLAGMVGIAVGEDWAKYESIAYTVPSTAAASVTAPDAPANDLWVPRPADPAALQFSWHSLDLFRPVGEAVVRTMRKAARLREPVLGLFSKRLPSRYASGAWADMHAGYGDVFSNDVVGRGHMNGAGLQDPDTAYVKLTFRF